MESSIQASSPTTFYREYLCTPPAIPRAGEAWIFEKGRKFHALIDEVKRNPRGSSEYHGRYFDATGKVRWGRIPGDPIERM